MKLLLTGDLHLGRSYQKESPELARRLSDARLEALEAAVTLANSTGCEFFIIAGDLYDKVSAIPKTLHQKVCKILDEFSGQAVLVLPGNHDYFDPERDPLWSDFEECSGSHVRLLKECVPFQCERVVFYPCPCHDKHAQENALGWLKKGPVLSRDTVNIGIAHGAVEGYSLDADQRYYYMTPQELLDLGMDAWLIGHTHVEFSIGNCIFNAGTPQQTDIADNSHGEVYIIEIDAQRHIVARKEKVGAVDFVRREVSLSHGQRLEDALRFPDLDPARTVLRVILRGEVSPEDHEGRYKIYGECGKEFLKLEVKDDSLQKTITPEQIDTETLDGTAINRLLHGYEEDADLLNLAYSLVRECKDDKREGAQ